MIKYISLFCLLLSCLAGYAQKPTPTRTYIDVYDYGSVDIQPEFPGGDGAMMHFINTERRYPAQAWQEGIQGRVRCSFVVDTDGSIGYVSVVKGVEESLDKEAVRIISSMPKWQAGAVDSVAVPVYCTLSISFRR